MGVIVKSAGDIGEGELLARQDRLLRLDVRRGLLLRNGDEGLTPRNRDAEIDQDLGHHIEMGMVKARACGKCRAGIAQEINGSDHARHRDGARCHEETTIVLHGWRRCNKMRLRWISNAKNGLRILQTKIEQLQKGMIARGPRMLGMVVELILLAAFTKKRVTCP